MDNDKYKGLNEWLWAEVIVLVIVAVVAAIYLVIISQREKQDVWVILATAVKAGIQDKEEAAASLEGAWAACTTFVDKQSGIPVRDAQKYKSGGVEVLTDGVYIVTVRYAKYGDIYRCTLLHPENGDWIPMSLRVKPFWRPWW
jgi:hypothetical protein